MLLNLKTNPIDVGTCGFSYDQWTQNIFYPTGVSRSEWLKFYASYFSTVEISLTFAQVPKKEVFVEWQQAVPEYFRFSLKGNQYITHQKKLVGISEPLRFFMDSVMKLKNNLGCIVWEIPFLGKSVAKKLEGFLFHLAKYSFVQHVFQFEEGVEQDRGVQDLIKKYSLNRVRQDLLIQEKEKTMSSPICYFRLNSDLKELQPSQIKKTLSAFSKKLCQLSSKGAKVYVYFGGDVKGSSLKCAQELSQILNR